jgi:hypothetical protein
MKYFGKFVVVACLLSSMLACQGQEYKAPEPHLELGQRISFVGGQPDKTYVIAGYRHYLEDKTEKNWQDQAYIVFFYTNNQGDIKVATIHRNAVLKR